MDVMGFGAWVGACDGGGWLDGFGIVNRGWPSTDRTTVPNGTQNSARLLERTLMFSYFTIVYESGLVNWTFVRIVRWSEGLMRSELTTRTRMILQQQYEDNDEARRLTSAAMSY